MKTDEIREKYLAFFESKGHRRIKSDVLVPTWDKSVLFTPAGMNQFKDHFLGKVKLTFNTATTCQKCLRTGDIDNVGRTAYHHTFFEMLGNFSFGAYFKRDAIHWAWEFLTSKEWLGIDGTRLTVTVYLDDDEAAGIWHNEIKLPLDRIERMGEADNFWPASAPSQGPDGVCGPCSEIYYKLDNGKSVEIWNLVFTQFNRVGEPPDNLRPLPSKNIDTGMGLERIASVMQGVSTNYHIDTLRPLVEAAGEVCGIKYNPDDDNGRRLRRIADHVRACSMAIHENVVPGPNKQRYVVKRLLRRAVLDGHQMGRREPFMYELVPVVAEMMKAIYPEHLETTKRVADVIKAEEANFLGTIDGGLAKIERMFGEMKSANRVIVPGQDAAELYQTYGVPPELVEVIAAEQNFTFDWDGYRHAMEEHGIASGGGVVADVFKEGPLDALKKSLHSTEFVGYEALQAEAEIKGIVAQHKLCDSLTETGHTDAIEVVLDRSPFYGESGGQVGDTGEISGPGFKFEVTDTQKNGDLIVHIGHLRQGKLVAGAKCTARVDTSRRNAIRRAHSATHILHYALQKQLGKHAQQQGSKVEPDALRFDFSNSSPVDTAQLEAIEHDVVERVGAKDAVSWKLVPLGEAREAGAMMLFGEKYPDPVRMVSIGAFSKELCGGIHLDNTSEVGAFEIISEESVSSGTRRVVAITGEKAQEYAAKTQATLAAVAQQLGVNLLEVPAAAKQLSVQVRDLRKALGAGTAAAATTVAKSAAAAAKASYAEIKHALRETARALNVALFDVPARVQALQAEVKSLEEQIAKMSSSGVLSADSLLEQATKVGDVTVIIAEVAAANANLMRQVIDQLRKRPGSTAVLLGGSEAPDKVMLIAGLSKDLVERGLSAGNWVKEVAKVVGGSGGGKPDLAQAGGKDAAKLPEAMQTASAVLKQML
ncbi:MAG TPA: alanine--tRNA ligase [Pirellulaceae bacterium]|nr:alanine--tRNA ligase [Pirellulaceae bacterium]